MERNFNEEQSKKYKEQLDIFKKVVKQKRTDKDKIYSIYKQFTKCIAKGKAHQPCEFGNKVGLVTTAKKGIKIIVSIKGLLENIYDGHSVDSLLNLMKKHNLPMPKEVVYDRGGKGKSEIPEVIISTSKPPLKRDSQYEQRKKQLKFRARAAIEPIIGLLKTDFKMVENYFRGEIDPNCNALLAVDGI